MALKRKAVAGTGDPTVGPKGCVETERKQLAGMIGMVQSAGGFGVSEFKHGFHPPPCILS